MSWHTPYRSYATMVVIQFDQLKTQNYLTDTITSGKDDYQIRETSFNDT